LQFFELISDRYSQKFRFYATTATISTRPSQCDAYTTIDDPTRNILQTTGTNTDTNFFSSGPRWVRFEGAGGTQIPTNPVPIYRCGTSASGWYSSGMPTVPDTTVNGTVCYTWSANNCSFSNQIQVTNCGSYYVYYLSTPPTSNLRYCTETPAALTTTSAVPTIQSNVSHQTQ
jgi:Notch-like protein